MSSRIRPSWSAWLLAACTVVACRGRDAAAPSEPQEEPTAVPQVVGTPRLVLQRGHSSAVQDVAFSPDGSRLVTLGMGIAKLWNVDSGRLLTSFDIGAQALAYVDDERIVAGGLDAASGLWELTSARRLRRFDRVDSRVTDLAVDPSGDRILSGHSNDGARLWDAHTGAALGVLGEASPVASVAWSGDGTRIAVSRAECAVEIWDAESNERLHTLDGSAGSARPPTFELLDEPTTERSPDTLDGDHIVGLDFSADGTRLLSGCIDGFAKLWDTQAGAQLAHLERDTRLGSVALDHDGTLAAVAAHDATLVLWEPSSGRVVADCAGHTSKVDSLAFSPDGTTLASGSGDNSVRLWRTPSCEPRSVLAGTPDPDTSVLISPDGTRMVTAGGDPTVRLWDLRSGRLLTTFPGHPRSTGHNLAMSTNGRHLATGGAGGIRLLDTLSGELLGTADGWLVVHSPDGIRHISTSTADQPPALWDTESGTKLTTFKGQVDRVLSARFADDGGSVVLMSKRGLSVRDARSGAERFHLDGYVWRAAISPDNTRLVTASKDTLHSWAMADGQLIDEWSWRIKALSIDFDASGSRVLTSHGDTLVIRDAASGTPLAELPARKLFGAAFLPTPADPKLEGHTFLVGVGVDHSLYHLDPNYDLVARVDLRDYEREDGSVVALASTEDGLYTGHREAAERLVFRLGEDLDEQVTVEQMFDYFHRSDLLDAFWRGERLALPPEVAEGVGLPPRVEILDVPAGSVESDTITVRVRAHSRGGGVERVWLFNNDTRVTGAGRGIERVAGRRGETWEQTFEVRLEPGVRNELRAEAYSEAGHIRSPAFRTSVEHRGQGKGKKESRLFMLVMSVERYEDPDMELFRSNDDAAAVTRAFERQKGRLFADVKIKSLVGRQVNLREIKGTLDSFDTGINDVVIVFAAGHGTVEACDDAQRKETYYFMTYPASLSSRSEICSQALSIDYLAELLDGLEANKKLLLFDSCKSGRAASARTLLSMRGGLEREAVQRLARAQGYAILASTGDNQSAIESDELGHGLFTYVLLEGLQAKPIVSIYSLADHVDHHLDLLASSHGRRQQATVATRGQNFSIYSVHPGDPSLIAAPQEPARRSDVLPQGLHERVAEHLRARSELILECLGRSAATVEAEVNDDGQVIFRAARVDPGSVEQRCMDEAIPPLRLEGARGWTRVPLSRPPPQ